MGTAGQCPGTGGGTTLLFVPWGDAGTLSRGHRGGHRGGTHGQWDTAHSSCPEGSWGHCKGSLGRAGQCPGTVRSSCPEGMLGRCHGDTQAVGHCLGTACSWYLEGTRGQWHRDMGMHRQGDTALALPALHALRGRGDLAVGGGHMGTHGHHPGTGGDTAHSSCTEATWGHMDSGTPQWGTRGTGDTGTVPHTGDTVPPCQGTRGACHRQDMVTEMATHELCHG